MVEAAPAKPLEQRRGHSLLIIRLIAAEKFIKGSLLVIIGLLLLRMLHREWSLYATLDTFFNALKLDESNHWIHLLLEKTLGIRRGTLRAMSVGTLVYAGLYFIEGAGLFLDKAWAEWLTVVNTALFLPLEIFEIVRHVTLLRIGLFILNLLIIGYLSLRLHWRHLAKVHARAHGAPLIIPRQTLPTGIKP